MDELRRHRRMKVPLKIELRHPSLGKQVVAASDMSDGGVFLLIKQATQLPVGDSVLIRTLELGLNGQDTGPPLIMTIVRQTADGIGLQLDPIASANLDSWENDKLARQAIRQCLLIANEFEQILIAKQGSSFNLPSRQLLNTDTWQSGIDAMLEKLNHDGVFNDQQYVLPLPLCSPTSLGEPGSIDLLVACSVTALAATMTSKTPYVDSNSYRWVDTIELTLLIPQLTSKLIDKALNQV